MVPPKSCFKTYLHKGVYIHSHMEGLELVVSFRFDEETHNGRSVPNAKRRINALLRKRLRNDR